ncbi:MAG: fructosamine kinase family protein [Bacteroidia bacterium]
MEIEKAVSKILGSNEHVYAVYHIGGGYINHTYKVVTDKTSYFLKSNNAKLFPKMFELEMKGLETLAAYSSFKIPKPIGSTEINNNSCLLMEYIDSSIKKPEFYELLGRKLAQMHMQHANKFGMEYNNYIGSLKQINIQESNWADFYIYKRLEPMMALCVKEGLLKSDIFDKLSGLENFAKNEMPTENPCLLHGDLWSGNIIADDKGEPVLVDPSIYYGHREMDIAMTLFIGSFDEAFYSEYHNIYPLEPNWKKRIGFCLIYYYLVHLNLFGRPYLTKTLELINEYAR